MALLTISSDGRLATVTFNETRIVDELLIRGMQEEIIDLIAGAKERFLLLNFRRVEFLSTSAFTALLRIFKKCKDFEVALRLSNIHPAIMDPIKICRLDRVFTIDEDAEDAIAAFQKEQQFHG